MVLSAIVTQGYNVVGVITETDEFDKKEEENYQRFAKFGAYDSLKEVANCLKLPVYQPKNVNSEEFVDKIEEINPNLIVIVSYHTIIKKHLIQKFKNRIINVHMAPLPKYRGRAPINWAIINGETHTAITVHFVDEGIDTGPIISQEIIEIEDDDRAIDVLLKGLPLFPYLVLKSIRFIEENKVNPKTQDLYDGSYFPKRKPEDGLIDWCHEKTLDIHNKVRALAYPYPGAFTFIHPEKKVKIERTSMPRNFRRICPIPGIVFGKVPSGGVKVTTIDGFIIIEKVRIDESIYDASEYLKLGTKLEMGII